jgi:hypothetical protein
MKWLLKIFPIKSIIKYVCDFLDLKVASKTKTPIDNKAINKLLKPFLTEVVDAYANETSVQKAFNNLALNAIEFISDDVKKELLEKLQDK